MDQSSGEQQALSALRWKLLQSQKRLSSPEDEKKIVSSMTFVKKKLK